MGTKAKWIIATAVLAAAVLLIAVKRTTSPRQVIVLPDGSKITFKGADFGQTHTYPPNARVLKFLCRFLPYSVSRKLNVQGGFAIGQDSIFLWYTQDSAPANRAKLQRVLVDDYGIESGVVHFGCSQNLAGGTILEGCGATVWPRRSARVGLRFYHDTGTNPLVKVGEFWMKNPRQIDAPQWTPEPLPSTRTVGDLSLSFLGNRSGRLPVSAANALPEDQRLWPLLRFRAAWQGEPSTAWQIKGCTLQDAGGNKLAMWQSSFADGDEEILPLRGVFRDRSHSTILPFTLWPGEKAWQIVAVLAPRAGAHFSAAELCTFRNLPVPEPDETVPLSASAIVQGTTMVLESLCGSDSDPSAEAHLFRGSAVLVTPHFGTGCSPVLVRAVDDAGRMIPVGAPVSFSRQVSTNSWRECTGTPLTIPATSKSLEITFGVTTNRLVFFQVPPPDLVPAKPGPAP